MKITVTDISDSDLEAQIAIMNVDNPIRITKTKVNDSGQSLVNFQITKLLPKPQNQLPQHLPTINRMSML